MTGFDGPLQIDAAIRRLEAEITASEGVPRPIMAAPKVPSPGDLLIQFPHDTDERDIERWRREYLHRDRGPVVWGSPMVISRTLPPEPAPRRRRWRLRARPMDARAWADVALIGAVGDAVVATVSHQMPGPAWLAVLIYVGIMLPAFYRRLNITRRTT